MVAVARPLIYFTVSFVAGIVLSSFIHIIVLPFIVFLPIFIIILLKVKYNLKKHVVLIIGVLFFAAGFVEAAYFNIFYKSDLEDYSNKRVRINGIIVSEPDVKDDKTNYVLKVRKIRREGREKDLKGKILISVVRERDNSSAPSGNSSAPSGNSSAPSGNSSALYGNSTVLYDYGECVEVYGEVKIPSTGRNPGGFNYKAYLAGARIYATMYLMPFNVRSQGFEGANPLIRMGQFIKSRVLQVINRSLPSQQAGLLAGILIGVTDGLDREVEENFRNCGLTHIMAVSGANIAFILAPFMFLFKKLRANEVLSNICTMAILTIFVLTVGFSPSVVRAAIMAYVYLAARIFNRETDIYSSISFAALIMLLVNPAVLYDVGFQLSYGGTFSMVLFFNNIKKMVSFLPGFISDIAAAALAAQIGVTPLSALYFNKISIVSFITNFLVVPVTEAVTLIGFIMAAVGQVSLTASRFAGGLNYLLLSFMLEVTKTGSHIPYAVVDVVTPSVLFLGAYYFTVIVFFWYIPGKSMEIKKKYIAIALSALIIAGLPGLIRPPGMEVTFLDVGQGDCSFINTGEGRKILIDGGGASKETEWDFDVGEDVVLPFLLDKGVKHIDMVFVTHGHTDHTAGLIPVLERISVDRLVIGDFGGDTPELLKLKEIANQKHIKMLRLIKGDRVRLDDKTDMAVVFPGLDVIDKNPFQVDSLNNFSYVLKLTYKNVKILFTGDIERDAEIRILQDNSDIRAQVLKVAHHGSAYSSSADFISSVSPVVAVVSVGRNSYGHPDEKGALKRLEAAGARIYRTDRCGAVIITTDGNRISIATMIR